ncbi:hypothetical protein EMCRGX_G011362 [Ephydatia muelleri]
MDCFSLLEKLGKTDSEKFVHGAINDVCGKIGLRYEDYAKSISLSDYSKLKNSLEKVIRKVSRQSIEKQEVTKTLSEQGAGADLAQLIAECLWVRKEEIREQLAMDSCNISQAYLSDFDWKLKLVMSSDKLGSIQRPVLDLDLDISEGGEKRREQLELTQEELEALLSSLDAANKVVTQLRT